MKIKKLVFNSRIGSLSIALTLAMMGVLTLIALANSGGDWTQEQPPNSPDARYGHSMVTFDDGSVMIFGGENANGDLFNDLEVFLAGNWQAKAPGGAPPTKRTGHSAVALDNGSAMIFGGKNEAGDYLNDLFVYQNNEWRPETPANSPPPARAYHGSDVLGDGRMVVVGGTGAGGTALNDIWFYKSSDRTWSQGANAPTNFNGSGVAALGDKVYVLGRLDDRVYLYDATQNTWSQKKYTAGSIPMLRKRAAVAQDGNKVWIMGGENYYNSNTVYKDVWELDKENLTWKQLSDMPEGLIGAAASVYHVSETQRRVNAQSTGQVSILLFGGKRSDGAVISATFTFEPPAPSASVVISPSAGGRLVFTGAQGLTTTVDVPPGAVSEAITLTYQMLYTPTHPISLSLGLVGNAFTLEAFQNGALQLGFVFSKPVTVAIHYSDAGIAGIDENALTLNYWGGSQWTDAAAACTPASTYERHPDENWLSVPLCHLSEFALLGKRVNHIYLPLVMRR